MIGASPARIGAAGSGVANKPALGHAEVPVLSGSSI